MAKHSDSDLIALPDDAPELTPEQAARLAELKAAGKGKKKRRGHGDGGGLNINSMMDIMTIMLVFLLVSVTSDPLSITENEYLKLSSSSGSFPAIYAVPITVTKKEIVVDKKSVVPVACKYQGRACNLADGDYEKEGASYFIDTPHKENGKRESLLIVPLKKSLDEEVKRLKDANIDLPENVREIYKANQGVVTVICDKDIPFRLIAEVVYTAARAELHNLRFAITYTENR